MRRQMAAALAALLVLALVPATAGANHINDHRNIVLPDPNPNSPTDWSLRWSAETFADDSVSNVLIGRADDFPDSLASGALQGDDTPLLLTATASLSPGIAEEIARLGATTFDVLGGTVAVSDAVVAEIEALGLTLGRRIQGPTRFETAVAAAEGYTGDTVIIARGAGAEDPTQAFADSLGAGGWAAETGWPILLTQTDVLHPAAEAYLEASDTITQAMIVGGTAAVGGTNESQLEALGLAVQRVAGAGRAATAIEIAKARGYETVADVARFLVVEGQQDDGYALGFPSAAHSALADAPVVLVVNGTVPPETQAWLSGDTTFDVDIDDPSAFPLFICGAAPAVCAGPIRAAIGLPTVGDNAAAITLDTDGGPFPVGTTLNGTATFDEDFTATLSVTGPCITDGPVTVAGDGTWSVTITGPGAEDDGACAVAYLVTYDNGTTQVGSFPFVVEGAAAQTGIVTFAGNPYEFVPTGTTEVVSVSYGMDDEFSVDGAPASMGVFTGALTVGDTITYLPGGAADGENDRHELVNVDPSDFTSGVIGNIDIGGGVLSIIEPVTGVTLRGAINYTGALYTIDGAAATEVAFEDDLNEGDEIDITDGGMGPDTFALTNRTVTGELTDLAVNAGVWTRFSVNGALGDDPTNAQDTLFEATPAATDSYTVDGADSTYAVFETEASEGDLVSYARQGGEQTFALTNQVPPPIVGFVTDEYDGNVVALGEVRVLLDGETTRLLTDFDNPGTTYTVGGVASTIMEFRDHLTAGDRITIRPADPPSGSTVDRVELVNAVLQGNIAAYGGASVHVTRPGEQFAIIYDSMNITGGSNPFYRVPDEPNLWFVDGAAVTEAAFDTVIATATMDEQLRMSIEVIATDTADEFRLDTSEV